ncbi:hypothetical protein DdX_10208 [Ditylenchus destructor]|uniref:Uncharacterized protein n=1 Tax=Ditylenchus destructor TaxID=166010 RepID=A0AAD4N1E8_9BILA|nr:hypothetical protein DdX_10208 [Ditylenchus destructor]
MNNCTYQETEFMPQDSSSENHYESAIHLNSTSVTERTSTPCDESKLKRFLNRKNKLLVFSVLGLVLIFAIGFVYFGISHVVSQEHSLNTQKTSLGAVSMKLTSCLNETSFAVENERALLQTCQNETDILQKQSKEQMLMILHQNQQIRHREYNISTLYAEIEKYENLTMTLQKEINAHKDLLLQKKGDLEAKDSAIALHQKYIKAVEGSLEPKDIQLAKQKAELESHLDKIQNQSSEIANLTANLEAERNKVLEHLRVNNVSKMDNEKLQDENLKQKLQIETHFEQLKLQNSLIETHMSRIKALEVDVLSKTNMASQQQARIEMLESMIQKYTAESNEKTEKINALSNDLEIKKKLVSDLEGEKQALQTRKEDLKSQIRTKDAEITRLEGRQCYYGYGYGK